MTIHQITEPDYFSGFLLVIDDRPIGLFATADAAAKWAIDNVADEWVIRPCLDPKSQE